ncbi:hypothetical protein YTPLAS18_17700 [Nitrospira sp.]|nr:hypothetical protein YTPLAS18_17700 [Nitrospira sp.]
MLSAKVLWPLFPLLLLVVVVSLTWALVCAYRRTSAVSLIWVQTAAFVCYLLAAVAAIASEGGRASVNLHRPFSILAQVCIIAALTLAWRHKERRILWLNAVGWGAILADTALHFVLR